MSNRSQGARKWLVAVIVAAGLLAADSAVAQKAADTFPTKPVRILVGFTPGSATDITARLIAPKLSEMWGQPVVIENRSGAGGTLAWAVAAKATPDGHTITVVSTAFAISHVLQGKNLPYDALKDFRAVTLIGTPTGTLVVAPSLGVKSVKELIALAKEKKVLYASTGAGSGTHMGTERFNMAAGIKPVHVAFKGQPEMIVEVVTGRVNFAIVSLGAGMPFIKDGRLRAARGQHAEALAANAGRAVAVRDRPGLRAGRSARSHGAGADTDAGRAEDRQGRRARARDARREGAPARDVVRSVPHHAGRIRSRGPQADRGLHERGEGPRPD